MQKLVFYGKLYAKWAYAWLLYIFWRKKYEELKFVWPVTNLEVEFIDTHLTNMENYRVKWTLSQSTFLDKLEAYLGLNGATPTKWTELAPSTDNVVVSVQTGGTCIVFIRAVGDNGKWADSLPIEWTARNEEVPKPVTGLTIEWVQHVE